MKEVKRVLRPGGTVVIFETLGTGTEVPDPPDSLKPYYQVLTDQYGFHHRWERADYTFASVEEARKGTAFFFGEDVSNKIIQNKWSIVPECAGIWWKRG
ncbi:class I SAM-dependent methyltransferase [Paenibacillus sabuli]|uniref:methyltransferase type 11 n=1 Tax=Paenibacillus sabuli TaxID=2772509 RepID=UPI0021E098B1|nr:methyltransferase type 11 [Paenibacillus sabuli]